MLDFRRDTWWLRGETSSPAEGLIPSARLCANKEATVFFLGFDVPRPRLRGRLSCYMRKRVEKGLSSKLATQLWFFQVIPQWL